VNHLPNPYITYYFTSLLLLILAVLSLRKITAPFLPYKPAEIMLWLAAPVHKGKFIIHYKRNVT
jgi:hypothetical protein